MSSKVSRKRSHNDTKAEVDIDLSKSSDEDLDAPPLKRSKTNVSISNSNTSSKSTAKSRSKTVKSKSKKTKPFNPKKYTTEPIEDGDYCEKGASNTQNLCCFGELFHLQSFDAKTNKLSRIKCNLFEVSGKGMACAKYGFITEKYLFCANKHKMAVVDISANDTNTNDNGRDKYNQSERQITASVICEYALPTNDVNPQIQQHIDRENKENEKHPFRSSFGFFGTFNNTRKDEVNVIATDIYDNYAVFNHGDYLYCVQLIDNTHKLHRNNQNSNNSNNNNNDENIEAKTESNGKKQINIL
eukprot:280982_1